MRFGADAGAGEIIILRPRGGLINHPDTLVIPLLVPDAPVVAWWPTTPPSNPAKDLMGAMARSRITDALHSNNPEATIERLRRNWTPEDIDLSWTRLTVWRAMLASMLDQPPHLPITAVKVACHNAARYFLLNNRGAIAPGYLGDFVIIDNFQDFNIERVFKKGELMVDHGVVKDFPAPAIDPYLTERAHSTFHVEHLTAQDFTEARPRGIIGMVNGEITTVDAGYSDRIDVEYDVLKIAVVERHKNTHHIGIGFLQGYGLKSGAVATSVSHDSHNIIVVGTSEDDCAAAANRVVELNGGIVVWDQGKPVAEVPLAIAGNMSDESLTSVNEKLEFAKAKAHELGVNPGIDPFMTLSFMALPVIPSLRITTRGVFDVTTQSYV